MDSIQIINSVALALKNLWVRHGTALYHVLLGITS